MVKITDSDDNEIQGKIILFEDELDNEDDEIPEASIMIYCQNGDGHLLYESDIRTHDV